MVVVAAAWFQAEPRAAFAEASVALQAPFPEAAVWAAALQAAFAEAALQEPSPALQAPFAEAELKESSPVLQAPFAVFVFLVAAPQAL